MLQTQGGTIINILTLDVESTVYKYTGERRSNDRRGSPFNVKNKLVSIALKWLGQDVGCLYVLHECPTAYIQAQIDKADIVVGHNIKFDFHWLMNVGVNVYDIKQVWDTMLAEHLLNNQNAESLKLKDVLLKYNKPPKLDVAETEYWSKCIDTDEIPVNILLEYNGYDVVGTESVFIEQYYQFTGAVL